MNSLSRTIAVSIGLALIAALFTFLGCSEKPVAPATPQKIVLIAGQPSHPSGQHEFNAGAIILARCLNEQSKLPVDVQVVHNGWPEDESVFDGAKAVIIYSDGNARHPVNGHEEKMGEMMAAGVGAMFMHYGVEVPPGEQGELFKKWIGGHYEAGFSTNPHWTADTSIDQDHPIARGVTDFAANDEWYYNMRFAEPKSARDILTAVPTREKINRYVHWTPAGEKNLGTRQALMWAVERPDGGRGVGFTGGHWHRNWALDDYRKTVLNAIVWTAGIDVPDGGVASDPVTEQMLNENLDQKKTMEHVALPNGDELSQDPAEPVPFKWPGQKK